MQEEQVVNRVKKADCVLLGSSGVGKSQLISVFESNRYSHDHNVTIGFNLSIAQQSSSDQRCVFIIKEISGCRTFRTLLPTYYRTANCIAVVYDISSRYSFQDVSGWMQEVNNYRPEKCELVLVGNKSDLEQGRQVSVSQGLELSQKLDAAFIETSAKTGRNVDKLFNNCLE